MKALTERATNRLREVMKLVGKPGVTPWQLVTKDHELRGVTPIGDPSAPLVVLPQSRPAGAQ
jgi:hypothetical protein